MSGAGPQPARGAVRLLTVFAAAAVFAAAWGALNPPAPPGPDADLYDDLAVARHLLRGDGFLSDTVYPLSLAFPFARDVPQPLVHRQPAWPLLLTVPVAAARDDPEEAVEGARLLALLLLSLAATAGLAAASRCGLGEAALPWLLLLLASPLLAMTTGWAQVEAPAGLALSLLWWRLRESPPGDAASWRRGAVDGALAACVALVRLDLCWVPWLWLVGRRRLIGRAGVACAVAWTLTLVPWGARNLALTGNPAFTLQAYAEHLKETPAWPGYSIYQSLSPEPFWQTLARDPALIATKTLAGLNWFAARLGRWLPWPLWLAALLLILPRRVRRYGPTGAPAANDAAPLRLLVLTSALLIVQYSALSHTLRYLTVLLPALGLEVWLGLAAWLKERRPSWPTGARALVLALWMAVVQLVAPAHVQGWEDARRDAVRAQADVARAVALARTLPPGPLFADSSAVLWRAGRAGVWLPSDPAVEAQVRARVPRLAAAPTVRLRDAP